MNRILILFLIIGGQLYSQNQTMEKINYIDLNSKQKENYNYHKVAAALAEYGYDSMRLNNDWQGADFIAVKNDEMLKVQLKGRFTINHNYKGNCAGISRSPPSIMQKKSISHRIPFVTNHLKYK